MLNGNPRTAQAALIAIAMIAGAPRAIAQGGPREQPDKYTWLEDVHGDRPMAWVKTENARTTAVLEKNPHFATL